MPPDGKRLTEDEVALLKRWIDQGAAWTDSAGGGSKNDSTIPSADFWSLVPPSDKPVPSIGDPWVAGAVDAFILERLQAGGLRPSHEADRRTLIRRVYLDVLGLPPTPEEIAEFERDESPDAWARLVDRVLSSPHYGERWARHWLDVVRFAETDGFETNVERPNAWHYRDYVINALNDDKPYDRFVFEQLAGDVVGEDAATGFLVGGPTDKVKSPDVVLTRMQRQDELADMINTTGTAFLGLTLGCAKCHNHKFDPISQKEYYAIQAILAGVRHGDRRLRIPMSPAQQLEQEAVRSEIARVDAELRSLGLRVPVNPRHNVEEFPAVTTRFVRFTVLTTNTGSEPCLDELEIFTAADDNSPGINVALSAAGAKGTASGTYAGSELHKLAHINDGRYGNPRSWISNENGRGWVTIELPKAAPISRIEWARDREGNYADRLPTQYVIEGAVEPGAWQFIASSDDRIPFQKESSTSTSGSVVSNSEQSNSETDDMRAKLRRVRELAERAGRLKTKLKTLEAGPVAYAGQFEQPEETRRLHRGDPMSPREVVPPGAIAALGPLEIPENAPEQLRRRTLAEWIVSQKNPLAARVIVNRIWQHHFGRGIVDTPSDFGRNGGRPSHPKLLDWLARELVRGGWSMKPIHRLILLSATYRQSAATNADGLRKDADSRLLWRYPSRRLEAEIIRDAMLAVSRTLDLRMEGPGFSSFEPNSNYVRVYRPKQEFGPMEWRRMIYMTKVRMEQDAVFGAFDCPDAGQVAPARTRSTTAIQALNLFNSEFTMQQAELFAERISQTGPPKSATGTKPAAEQVKQAFLLVFGREPDADELAAATRLVDQHGTPALARALFNSNEFLFLP